MYEYYFKVKNEKTMIILLLIIPYPPTHFGITRRSVEAIQIAGSFISGVLMTTI